METVTDIMDTAAATADLSGDKARQSLLYSMESLRENLAVPVIPDGSQDTGITKNKHTMKFTDGDRLHSKYTLPRGKVASSLKIYFL